MRSFQHFIKHLCDVWLKELTYIFKDEAMLIFLVLLPIGYPILYSWIYNNEVVREVPVVVIDKSNSSLSRKFIRMYDASPNVRVAYRANSLAEAKDIIGHQDAYGVLVFPSDFETKVNRMEQATVSIYCDMSLMLAYKNIYQTATSVQGLIGAGIQQKLSRNMTAREDIITVQPLDYDEVAIFNTTGGYGNFILPAVLILILQQTILLGMGLTTGTVRERYGRFILPEPAYNRATKVVFGKWAAYMLWYIVLAFYTLLVVPKLFGFVNIMYWRDLILFILPYLISCIFFAMTTMTIIRRREDVLIIVVFTSVPLLFMSGVSWPGSALPAFWKYLSFLFPSTFGVNAFIKMNSMGARIEDVQPELIYMWIQASVYFWITFYLYHRELKKKVRKV